MTSTERLFLQQLLKGNPAAIKKLMDTHSTKVYNTAYSYVKNHEDAEEVTQDVFIAVLKGASSFRHQSSISTWVYRVTINKSLDFLKYRDRKKRKGNVVSIYSPETGEVRIDMPSGSNPEQEMLQADKQKLILAAIDRLPENQKTATILVRIEGLSQKEAAEAMQTTVKSVESLLQRAKKNLKTILSDIYEELK
ncbi:MAG: RNA polymerase sigma factor [Saprospiraceae bacterium]|nr:RNA polymerase sigma factor [Saprospiraceae bacterium]